MPLDGLEQHAPGQGIRRFAAESHDRQHLDVRRNLQFAQILDVGLKIIRFEDPANLIDLHLQRMLSHRDAQYSRRRQRRQLRRLARRHLPRAGRKYEAYGIDVGISRRADRIRAGDAANFDPHGAECSHLRLYCPRRREYFAQQH